MTAATTAASAGRAMLSTWGCRIRSASARPSSATSRIAEEAHDSYATIIHVYGWGGALIWYYGISC